MLMVAFFEVIIKWMNGYKTECIKGLNWVIIIKW